MANPIATFDESLDGIRLVPYSAPGQVVAGQDAWIGAKSPTLEAVMSMEIFTLHNRREEPSQDGVLHRDRGSIDGYLLNNRMAGLTADQWLTRLENLIANQRNYWAVFLVSTRYAPFKVKLHALSKDPVQAGGFAWVVNIPFREVD